MSGAARAARVAVGDELPELRRVVTRDDVRAYAEASGDRNPLHLDDEVARAAGFEGGVIAHGMFTMGHMATCVIRWAGPGAVVERLSATFRAPVSMGDEIVAGGRVRAVDGARVTVDAWVRLEGEGGGGFGDGGAAPAWPVKKGEVVLRVPAGDG